MQELWAYGPIPFKDNRGTIKIVSNLIDKWTSAKEAERKSDLFQKDLDTLLDIRPELCKDMEGLVRELKKRNGADWKNDSGLPLFF